MTTATLDKNQLAKVNCIIVLGDEALSPETDEGIVTCYPDDHLNERIVEGFFYMKLSPFIISLGASSPENSAPLMPDSQNTSGLWGLRIRIEALDIIPDEFSDVFCQFSLFGRCEESWSTEPIAIMNGSATCHAAWDLAVKSGPELLSVCFLALA